MRLLAKRGGGGKGSAGAQSGEGLLAVPGQRLSGFCKQTLFFSDCRTAKYGAWQAPVSLRECISACEGCARCKFVSFSAQNRDCSWFAGCNASSLGNFEYGGGNTYTTVRVKPD